MTTTVEEVTIEPQPGPQRKFARSRADIAIYGGAAGGGKSWSLLIEPLRHIGNGGFGTLQAAHIGEQLDHIAQLRAHGPAL